MLRGTQQTKKAWALKLRDIDEIPEMYRPIYETLPIPAETFPLVVLTPRYQGIRRKMINEKLVIFQDQALYVMEKSPEGAALTTHNAGNMVSIERGTILLKSWLIFKSIENDQITTTKLEFSSATLRFFREMIRSLRGDPNPATSAHDEERRKLNALLSEDYKFTNFAKKSLRSDSVVKSFIFQPQITKPLFKRLSGKLRRAVVPNHICILTDDELILIREEMKNRWHSGDNYGGVWTYLMREQIERLVISDAEEGMLKLEIKTGNETSISAFFSGSKKEALSNLIKKQN